MPRTTTTDPEARLHRKGNGREAKLYYMGHVLMENRHGLVVRAQATAATGTAERDTAEELLEQVAGERRVTVGADKASTPRNSSRPCATWTSRRTLPRTRASGAVPSICGPPGIPAMRWASASGKRVEEVFAWLKTVGLMRKLHHRGTDRVDWLFVFACAIYNLVRIRNLQQALAWGAAPRCDVETARSARNARNKIPRTFS